MAYDFVGTSNQYLSASAPVSAAPFTVSCWARLSATSGNRAIVSLGTGNNAQRFLLYFASGTLAWFVNDTSFSQAIVTGIAATNTWHHCLAVEESSSNRTVYFNGIASSSSNPGSTSGTRSPASVDELNIGIDRSNNTLQFQHTGQIADLAIWSIALTASEITSLSKGFSADKIQPQSQVFYAPLVRDIIDYSGGLTITNNNSATVADHPRVYA